MIDTIRADTIFTASSEPREGWTSDRGTRERVGRDGEPSEWACVQHVESGLRVFGNALYAGDHFVATKLEVSLPRLLHGTNGRLLKDQREVDQALACMERLVAEVWVPGTREPAGRIFTRVDLVWQFEGRPSVWIQDLQRSFHPQIRRAKVLYEGESLHFPGKHRHLRIYDKAKESQGRKGEVVRCELQLTGKPLRQALGLADGYTDYVLELSFSRAYQAFRDFLVEFEPVRRPKIGKMVDFLRYCEEDRITDSNGQLVFDLWAVDKHPVHVRRVKGEIQRARVEWEEFSFRAMLPEDGPPFPVELLA